MTLFFHAILILGLLHGLALIWLLYRNVRLNPVGISALLLGLVSVWCVVVEETIVTTNLWVQFPHILRLTTWMPFLIGPSIWLFARSLLNTEFKMVDLLHFVPAILAALYFFPFYFQTGADKIAFVYGTSQVPLVSSLLGTAKIISVVGYSLFTLIWLRRRTDRINSPLSRWMQRALFIFVLFLIPLIVLFALEHRWPRMAISSDLVGAIYLAAIMYILSLLVLSLWGPFAAARQLQSAQPDLDPKATPSEVQALLDPDTAQSLFESVSQQVKDEELYKTPGISLRDLSELVGVADHYLSYIVNNCAGQNYNRWLNGFRVDAAKGLLFENPNATVLQVGLDAGFNSKAAFNRVFKQVTGVSPTAFREGKDPT